MREDGNVLSVSELTGQIKSVLEADFRGLAVQGEISNFKRHTSGHLYFTLKDEKSQVQAVMWRSRAANLFFTPRDGMKVVVRGNVTVYEVRGVYQIDAAQIQPLGVGELQLAFERLKQKLADEGLFEAGHKKALPQYPARIGIVTSPTGAAIRDIINIISRRFPSVELILSPVRVQGPGSADEIAAAIEDFNRFGGVDVLLVGRGGGSLEDLWAFNEEVVARAIFNSRIPIVSAVGHEIDFTIADFVADLRAPTPSAAAELIVRDRQEVVEVVRGFCYNAYQRIHERLNSGTESVRTLCGSYAFNRPMDLVRQYSQRLDDYKSTLSRVMLHRLSLSQQSLTSFQLRIESVNPALILRRGYAIVRKGGSVVSKASGLHAGDRFQIEFHDGSVSAGIRKPGEDV